LADYYEHEAKRHDDDAAEDAWRYKMATPANKESPPQAAPLFPLSRVKLENFRGLANFDLSLDPHLNVLIGRNATGKTTVLDALAAGLAVLQDELFGSKIVDQLIDSRIDRTVTWLPAKEPRQADSLHLQFWGQTVAGSNHKLGALSKESVLPQEDSLRWSIQRSPTSSRGPRLRSSSESPLRDPLRSTKDVLSGRETAPLPVPIFAYYGTKRAMSPEVLKQEAKHLEDLPDGAWLLTRASAYDGALDATAGYKVIASWWRSRQTAEHEKREELNDRRFRLPELEAVRVAVNQAVRVTAESGMRCSNPRTQSGRPGLVVDFDRGDGSAPEIIELGQMSDGFRTHLALVMDLARRMVQANPPPDGDIQRDSWGTRSRAVVLIDEVDLHLHPSWQRYVLAGLRAAFPNTQFIVTTHSPQVIASVAAHHVFKLGKGPTPTHPAHTKGMDSNTILTAVMGDRHRDADAQNELDALADLIDAEQFDKARVQLQQLAQKYGSTDPEVTRLGGLLRFLDPDDNSSKE
jgi:predicted ATP-binding protein involved in virulence